MHTKIRYDLPISGLKEDKFSRGEFGKRIGKTILDWSDPNGFAIGIYGGWGEGKSSILNIIEEYLRHENSVIVIKYNPWRFASENELLLGFFHTLADGIDQEIKTTSEKIGNLIKGYADIVLPSLSFFGMSVDLGKSVKSLGERLSESSIESTRSKIAEILLEQQKKVVVIIDDIDRLEKKEMQALFKLVKLNADFKYVTYILSFDDQIVSHALGEVYGKGDKEAGYEYLEKIIQVPLRVPKASNESLGIFALDMLEELFILHKVNIHELDRRWLRNFLEEFFLPYVTTPRTIVRYSNILSFSISVLPPEEICILDLCIVEIIKILYPELYNFIEENPVLFLGYFDDEKSYVEDKGLLESQIDNVLSKYDIKNRINSKKILSIIFPKCLPLMQYRKNENISIKDISDKDYGYSHKRIYSAFFVERYFTLAVSHEEIPQHLINIIFYLLSNGVEAQYYIDETLSIYGPERLIKRLRKEIKVNKPKADIFSLLKSLERHIQIFYKNDDRFFSTGLNLYDEFINFCVELFDDIRAKMKCEIIESLINIKYNYDIISNIIFKLRFNDLVQEESMKMFNNLNWYDRRDYNVLDNEATAELSSKLFDSVVDNSDYDIFLSKNMNSTWRLILILSQDVMFGEQVVLSSIEKMLQKEKKNINYFLLMIMDTYGISYSRVKDEKLFCKSKLCDLILLNIDSTSSDLSDLKERFILEVNRLRSETTNDLPTEDNSAN